MGNEQYKGSAVSSVVHDCKAEERVNNAHVIYTVSQKNPRDYVFDDNLNSKRPIVIIFGTVIN